MNLTPLKILIFTDYYIPFYKAGGPITSIYNVSKYLSDNFNFWICCKGADIDGSTRENLLTGVWTREQDVNVFYSNHKSEKSTDILKLIYEVNPEVIYLNSMFSWYYTLRVLLRVKLNAKSFKIILAPRGMLKMSALNHKKFKKHIFLMISRRIGLFDMVLWQATNEKEKSEILSHFPDAISLY